MDKCNFKNAKVLLKKVINYKKTLYLEHKIRENKNNPIKFWWTLKSQGIPSKWESHSKISLKENSIVFFNSKDNRNTFCMFFSNVADLLLQKLPHPKSKFGINTTEKYY